MNGDSGNSSGRAGSWGTARIVKTILISILLLIAALVLAFGPRAEVPTPPGRTLVTYWEKWTGNEAAQMQEIVNWFNDTVGKEKHIYVRFLSMSNIDRKTLVATAAGVPPDVAGLWDSQVAQFSAIDALEPLDALAAEHQIIKGYYKPVYWQGCQYKGKLYALISTPAVVALHYNKQIFVERAKALEDAGLDPNRPPRTLQELDAYAKVLDDVTKTEGRPIIIRAGYLPMEPGWFSQYTGFWFGSGLYDADTERLHLNDPDMIRGYNWVRSYAERLGSDSVSEFRSGLGQFNSTQNAFMQGKVAMEQQGPWMANFIENLTPQMNRWHVPQEKIQRERDFGEKITEGMARTQVEQILGPAMPAPTTQQAPAAGSSGQTLTWDGGIKLLHITFVDGKVTSKDAKLLPSAQRKAMTQWGAEAFPSDVPGLTDVTYAGFDVLVIPKGAAHKNEAMEFIAFVNRQDVMEKLCSLHCKNSPLAKVSQEFLQDHPNPYIDVFERLAASPNARTVPPVPVWPEVNSELQATIERVNLLKQLPKDALDQAQNRAQKLLDGFLARQKLHAQSNTATSADPVERGAQ